VSDSVAQPVQGNVKTLVVPPLSIPFQHAAKSQFVILSNGSKPAISGGRVHLLAEMRWINLKSAANMMDDSAVSRPIISINRMHRLRDYAFIDFGVSKQRFPCQRTQGTLVRYFDPTCND
jgi:hypothetical protein